MSGKIRIPKGKPIDGDKIIFNWDGIEIPGHIDDGEKMAHSYEPTRIRTVEITNSLFSQQRATLVRYNDIPPKWFMDELAALNLRWILEQEDDLPKPDTIIEPPQPPSS